MLGRDALMPHWSPLGDTWAVSHGRAGDPWLGVCAAERFSKLALLRRLRARGASCERLQATFDAVQEGNVSIEKIAPHIES
jgi:hypothetical protein